MALIKCPECGTEVSSLADKCPKCAYPIKKTSQPSNPSREPKVYVQHTEPKGEGCFLQTLNFGCMTIAVIIGLIILLGLVAGFLD